MEANIMQYDKGLGLDKNWIITESRFSPDLLGKCEAIFSLGNGYMGQRSVTEEKYVKETRNLFIAGTFNKFAENEVTELPNAADVLWMDFKINGQLFKLERGKIHSYERSLHLRKAELLRQIVWEAPNGEKFQFSFRRFVSLDDLHLIGQKVEITPLDRNAQISLVSGIDGQMSNSGVQHFLEGDKRLFDKTFMQLVQTTNESQIDFVFNTTHTFTNDGQTLNPEGLICMERRQIFYDYQAVEVKQGTTLVIEKLSNVFTSRDKDWLNTNYSLESLKQSSLNHIKTLKSTGFEQLFTRHVQVWEDKIWGKIPISIVSDNEIDQLAIRFAQYHITVMTPAHDNRMNIGAKGLSGEGYKGHTFWDTEIFLLPYFIYKDPKTARSLLEYRYLTLPGAHKKAEEYGLEGAMFPWESAWMDDGEVTPVWGAADIITGQPTKIWTGFIEQHVISDIAFATWQYFQVTKDEDFMLRYGYELMMDTAKFWASRLEWHEEKQEYHINNVIGPDEYKEHVNNNAFTNYTAHWNIKKAMEYYHLLQDKHPNLFACLNEKLNLEATYQAWESKIEKIYLPQPRKEDLVIPQDDTYLTLDTIDLTKYKKQENVGSLFKDYNMEQVGKIQVSKQADIMVLFYLLEDLFSQEVKRANWEYYEPKTLHDSSLSLSTHSVLASDIGDEEMAYQLFHKALNIDLGPNMNTSNHGIHAASLGGIWQCVVNGFGGVRMLNGKLRISPKLPKPWSLLTFEINWHGDVLVVQINKEEMTISKKTKINESVTLLIHEVEYTFTDQLAIKL